MKTFAELKEEIILKDEKNKRFEEKTEKIEKVRRSTNLSTEYLDIPVYDDYYDFFTTEPVVHNTIQALFANLIKKVDNKMPLYEYYHQMGIEYDQIAHHFQTDCSPLSVKESSKKDNVINQYFEGKDPKVALEGFEDFLKTLPEDIQSKYPQSQTILYSLITKDKSAKDKMEIIAAIAEKNNINLDSLIDEDVMYKYEKAMPESIKDTYPYEEKINDVISKLDPVKDAKVIEDLKAANKNLISVENTDKMSDAAEKYGNDMEVYKRQQSEKALLADENYKYRFDVDGRFVYANVPEDGSVAKCRSTIVKNIEKNHTELNEEETQFLTDFYYKLKEQGILNNEKRLVEEGSKEYAFRPLVLSSLRLKEAFDANDMEKIKEEATENARLGKCYHDALKKIKDYMPHTEVMANISCGRNQEVPEEFRMDVVSASQLNGMQMINGFVEYYDLDFDEFLANPYKTFENLSKKVATEQDYTGRAYTNCDHPAKYLKQIDQNFNDMETLSDQFERVMGSIASFIKDDARRAKFQAEETLYFGTFIDGARALQQSPYGEIDDDGENAVYFTNYLVQNKDDFDFEAINTTLSPESTIDIFTKKPLKAFDAEKYLKKHHNLASTLLKTYDCYKELSEVAGLDQRTAKSMAGAKTNICNMALRIDGSWHPVISDAAETIKKNGVVKPTMRENLKAVAALEKFEYAYANHHVQEAAPEMIKAFVDLKKSYANRNPLAKIFYHNVREQSFLIDQMEDELKRYTKLSDEAFKDVCDKIAKEDIGKEEPENNLEENNNPEVEKNQENLENSQVREQLEDMNVEEPDDSENNMDNYMEENSNKTLENNRIDK